LKEIPLSHCTKNEILFTAGKSTFIHIYASDFDSLRHTLSYVNHPEPRVLIDNYPSWGVSGKIPIRKVDSLFVVIHSHFLVRFPPSSFTGIYEPHFCGVGKKGRLESPYNKVFQSEDKRRIYIYMLNGEGADRYEVSWVIQDGKYCTRVIDPV
jgi:hypothetical protein